MNEDGMRSRFRRLGTFDPDADAESPEHPVRPKKDPPSGELLLGDSGDRVDALLVRFRNHQEA